MSGSQINVVPIACCLSNLTVFTTDANSVFPNTILQSNQPFSLKVTVEFSGPGAIAFVPLAPSIQVEFYAKPLSPDPGIVLGKVEVKANPNVLTYPLTLTLPPPTSIGLRPKTIYSIGSVLQIGNPDWPSFINGFTEELTIEIYATPPEKKSK
ncbi:hypothetical protein H6G89_27530 [Oscillatoria sp. FACHB-1407]|uniref:hypothetical protein n=1 Tax=Oscillatoria sp. FACHB-1407 TaxID=2692847 RepID=UPI001682AD6C|nr:hypothetical protein [Oscillatoria sp. FACHB-1407]MBD2464758.1 hypothetical protein [Oscillatoria sp. FACHB-1407]